MKSMIFVSVEKNVQMSANTENQAYLTCIEKRQLIPVA